MNQRTTIKDLQAATDAGEKWAMLTSYDALTARVFEEAGVRALLVGDSAGMVVYGDTDTVGVTMEQMIPLVAGVVRGTELALIVADLPFGSYQPSVELAMTNAVRFMKECGAQAVKLEGGKPVVPQVRALTDAGIPVMGHLGLTPQSVNALGGMKVQGKGDAGDALLEDALALEAAGAFAVVLEAVPSELGTRVSNSLRVPTIGIGAGAGCDAQILVWQDMAGLTNGPAPKFVKRYADVHSVLSAAVAEYVAEVQFGTYPDDKHSYR